jgi:glutamate--cysteine ligase
MLPFVFEAGMGFDTYVEYALDVPMYFVYRDGRYVDVAGASFRDFLDGRLAPLPGVRPTLDDWSDHITTLFPEVRLKRFLEMRGADGGRWRRICALPALWVGLLYDEAALDAAWELVKGWSREERQALREDVPKGALGTRFRNTTVHAIAREVVAIAHSGLENRNRRDGEGRSETIYLDVLEEVVQTGATPADELLSHYRGDWHGNIDRVFAEYAF